MNTRHQSLYKYGRKRQTEKTDKWLLVLLLPPLFKVKVGQLVPLKSASSIYSKREHLGINRTRFLWAKWPSCQSTGGNTKQWPTLMTWRNPVFIHKRIPGRKCVGLFMSVLWQQWMVRKTDVSVIRKTDEQVTRELTSEWPENWPETNRSWSVMCWPADVCCYWVCIAVHFDNAGLVMRPTDNYPQTCRLT